MKAVSDGEMTYVKQIPLRFALKRPQQNKLTKDSLQQKVTFFFSYEMNKKMYKDK